MAGDRDSDPSRRDLGAFLVALGGTAGLAALEACLPAGGAGSHGAVHDRLTGTTFWVDTVVAAVPGRPGAEEGPSAGYLRGVSGTHDSGSARPVAVVGGYSKVGDDGGGIFYWSNASGTDDGGTVIVPRGAAGADAGTSGCWRRVYSGPLDVKWFGAKGDGETDDARAIAAAIASGAAKQAEVFFPPGVYMVGTAVELRARVSLRGAGTQWRDNPGSCIRARNPMPCVLRVASPDVRVEGLWIDGNFLADNVVLLQYPADNGDFDRVFITRARPLTTPVDVTRSNLVTVAAGSTIGIAAMNFRACSLNQDPFGEGGSANAKRGHACVSNYFPGVGAGGSANAFRWLFDDHCTFWGQQFGYRTKFGGATFAHSEFYNIEVALFAVELNQPVLVVDCYTEPGQKPQTTYPKVLLQEESVQGAPGMTGGEINLTHCQFNTPGADLHVNGKAPVRIDDCTINGDVIVEPARSGGATMPIMVLGCGFGAGRGVVDASAYPFLSTMGNFTVGVGAPGQPRDNRIGATLLGPSSSGVITIVDPATTARVVFAKAEADAKYHVILSVADASRPSAAKTPHAYAFETSGFTIGLSGPMGAGQSCRVFWQLAR